MTYEQEVWYRAIVEAEEELMRYCVPLQGGKKAKETHEQYAKRGILDTEKYLKRLAEAKNYYKEVGGKGEK